MDIKTEIHEPDAETKWFGPISDDLRAAFPGVNFTLVASGFAWGRPVIQIEWGNGNDAPAYAAHTALLKYQGVIDLILDFTPSFKELAKIEFLLNKYQFDDLG